MDYFFEGHWRMDWGFGNPNKTAALIAMLMVGSWIFAYGWKKGFWASLTMSGVLGACLISTYSRGGLVAAGFGLGVLVVFAPRPWKMNRVLPILWMVVGLVIYAGCSHAFQRYCKGMTAPDVSIGNRLEIWSQTPKMLVDAPSGWGLGNSGSAYMQWYQNPERNETYRTLVNSHLTWLVEFGWGWRFLYLLGWGLIFSLCFPSKKRPSFVILLAVWVAFAVAAFFSSVAESPYLWILPIICLTSAFVIRIWRKECLTQCQYWIPVITASLFVCLFLFLGRSDSVIRGSSKCVILGNNSPDVWIIVDPKTFGKEFGKPLRQWFKHASLKGVGVVNSIHEIPSIKDKIVILGASVPSDQLLALGENVPFMKKLILVNPSYFPEELSIPKGSTEKVEVIFGEFSQSQAINAWVKITTPSYVKGVGDFLPNWIKTILETQF